MDIGDGDRRSCSSVYVDIRGSGGRWRGMFGGDGGYRSSRARFRLGEDGIDMGDGGSSAFDREAA
jgi:hypothetical protein